MAETVWTREKVEQILMMAQDILSLNTPVGGDGDGSYDMELGELIEDSAPNPEDLALIEGRREKLLECMSLWLKPRDVEILLMRYGFTTGTPMTLEEIGQHYGLTRERIRQAEERALRILRFKFANSNIVSKEDF